MLSVVDIRTALTILAMVVSATATIFTLKGDIKGLRELFNQHAETDTTSFQDLRSQVAEFAGLFSTIGRSLNK